MNHDASPSAPARRARRAVLPGLAVLGVAGALFLLRGPLMMSAPRCMAGRWHGCYDTFNGVVLMTLVTLPLAVAAAWVLARVRTARVRPARVRTAGGGTSTGTGGSSAWRLSLAEVGMVHGTVPFLWLTMMPGAAPGSAPARVSLVPLRDLVTMGPLGIVGNLLVFAPLGFFAPIRFPALASLPRILALGAGCSALVESAQYVLWLDRVSSVDDVLVNAAGAVLAGLASRRWWRTPSRTSAHAPATSAAA
ncbi:VanZ family protein [Streptomyces roseus]|uniref:Teicoplanin resistance protein VanZ n=1 Tax=Streptomyces roseus TaxID=66430 RepID=A0A0J6XE03_9ACTN|nr:VanZ family protein [Streptomyces roseus]KMO94160.1 teicoplanin resistance protein VanZ [Streptomyces roseus]